MLQQQNTSTVYSFEFAQSYFRPIGIWNRFAQSWIRPLFNIVTHFFIYLSISPVLNSPSSQRTKRAKIKRGRSFPCIQYVRTCEYDDWPRPLTQQSISIGVFLSLFSICVWSIKSVDSKLFELSHYNKVWQNMSVWRLTFGPQNRLVSFFHRHLFFEVWNI